jgi:hypothetical protein
MERDFNTTYEKNLQSFKQNWTAVYQKVMEADISKYELVLNGDNVNVKVNGHLLYPEDVDTAINSQVQTFLDNPTSFFQKPGYQKLVQEELDDEYIHDNYLQDIQKNSPYLKDPRFKGYSHNIDHAYPYFLMFGIGTGVHIEKLIKKCDIKNIVIMDEDYSFLKVSMHIVDWHAILVYFSRPGYSITFKTAKTPEYLSYSVINELFAEFPHFISFIPFYMHYQSDFFKAVRKEFEDKIRLALSGLGFYDDEWMSLDYTIKNISHATIPVFKGNTKLPENSSVFVIAAGPSIDNDIEYIKKYKDQVVIISSGTALRILIENDIIPDYHLETERTYSKYVGLSDMGVEKKYFDQIPFIGLNVIHPEVWTLFKHKMIFCRENDCGSSVLPNIPRLDHCNPTATNGALSFATELGFDNIYLFGTDVGYWSEENHHSKDTAYYDKSCKKHYNMRLFQTTRSLKSNFREEDILSTEVLFWCKQRMENCITAHEKLPMKYFNCSDGAYVKGALPLHAKDLLIDNSIKKEMLYAINKSFITKKKDLVVFKNKTKKIFQKNRTEYIKNLDKLIKLIKESKIETYSEMYDLINLSYNIITTSNPDKSKGSLTFSFLRGTLYHIYAYIYAHSLAVHNKEKSFEYIHYCFEKVLEFLYEIKSEIKKINID